jgi:septum formation protein
LEAAGLHFAIRPAEVDETPLAGESPEHLVLRLSSLKAHSVQAQNPDLPVLSADTIVALGETVFGKPDDLSQAKAMLQALSGQVHRVITGYTVIWAAREREKSGVVISKIAFRELTEVEIDWYLSLDQSLDKAGAYAIQLEGGFLTDWLEGSYTNIVGLPVKETLLALSEVLGPDIFPKRPGA